VQPLRRRLELSPKPCIRSEGVQRVDLFDRSLMDVIARRAFARPDVEAHRAGCNPRPHGSCLAHGANWSTADHGCFAFVQKGASQNSQSPVDTEGVMMKRSMEPSQYRPLFRFAHIRK